MAQALATDMCRVALIAPHRTMEIALPAGVPLADLVPVLVQRVTMAGYGDRPGRRSRGGQGLTGEGDWVLQRLGHAPLEDELTLTALGVKEGETLYLRPRAAQLPPAHFDDLIDGLAIGLRGRGDRWREPMTRAGFGVVGGLALGGCLALLVGLDPIGQARLAAVVAALAVLGALMSSRAQGDRWAAVILGVAAVPFAALAGFWALAEPDGPSGLSARVLTSAAAAAVVGLAVKLAIGDYRAMFLAISLAGATVSVGGLLAVLGLSAPQAAGAVVVLALIASTFAPRLAFRLARLRLPQLPTSAVDLADDIEPYPGPPLMAGAVMADTYLNWLSAAVGAVCTAGVLVLVEYGRRWDWWLVVTICAVLLLRSRTLASVWQRGSVLAPALLGTLALVVRLGDQPERTHRVLMILVLLVTAGIALSLSRSMPGRRLLPHWGRIADLLEYLAALGMVMLLLAVFDAYQWARALAG